MFYEEPKMEIVLLDGVEVITALSNAGTGEGSDDEWGNIL